MRASCWASRRLWTTCAAIAASVGWLSCGGRAADGPGLDGSLPGVVAPGDDDPGDDGIVRPMRETCEDNPLLAGCPYSNGGSSSGGPLPPPPPDSPPNYEEYEDEEEFVIAAAENVLASYCGACHGSALTEAQASAAINYVDDWDELVEEGLVQRCWPERSRVIEVMRSGRMPPAESGLAVVPEAEINFVANAIEVDCDGR